MAKFKKRFSRAMIYLILVIVAFISIFPCYWMLASAFNSTEQIVAGRILPSTHFVENLKNLFATYPIMQGLWNSAKIAVITVVISLLITSLSAYGFEKFGTRTSEKVYGLVLIGMMVPFSALVVPLYKTMATIGLTNSHWAIILPAIGSIFLLFFFRQSFKSIPNEILEAARIDGHHLRLLSRLRRSDGRARHCDSSHRTHLPAASAQLRRRHHRLCQGITDA